MIPESEVIGNQVAQELQNLHRRLEAAKGFARALLLHVSTPGNCKGCAAPIRWVRHIDTGKNTPYDLDGVNHFVTCPERARFKRVKEEQHGR